MNFLQKLQTKKGIKEFSAEYFELTYIKHEDKFTMIFMAPDMNGAKIKAKSVLRNYGGKKILNIRKLDSKNLGPEITWNKDGSHYERFSTRSKRLSVRTT